MKKVLLCTLFVVAAIAEPPVDNRYLPPSQGYRTTNTDSFSPPSQNYGPPEAPLRQTDAVFRNRPSTNYGLPRAPPSNQYGPPNRSQMRRPSAQYGPPSQLNRNQPSSQLNSPTPFNQNQPSNQYLPPSQSSPSDRYNAPGVGARNGPSRQPAIEYGAPSQFGGPSQQYGAPNPVPFGGSSAFGGQSQRDGGRSDMGPERQYLPPNGRQGNDGDDEGNNEPANYSFEYMVKDDESGNDFGHRESRQGGRAEGLYYVLLPDGRKQTVEYEADENGYKPRISYEDTGLGQAGGYDRNSQGNGGRGQSYQDGQSGPY